MERTPLTYQWLEESGNVDHELMLALYAKRVQAFKPKFFMSPPYEASMMDELMIRCLLNDDMK